MVLEGREEMSENDDLTGTEEYKHECWKLGLAASETLEAASCTTIDLFH